MPDLKSKSRQIAHESVTADTLEIGSDRSFGIIMASACGLIALGLWIKDIATVPVVLTTIAGLFLILAVIAPSVLRSANVLWMKFAYLLHRIISPVILAILFYGAFTPTALWIKLTGKDPLHLTKDLEAESYWIDCSEEKTDLKKQF